MPLHCLDGLRPCPMGKGRVEAKRDGKADDNERTSNKRTDIGSIHFRVSDEEIAPRKAKRRFVEENRVTSVQAPASSLTRYWWMSEDSGGCRRLAKISLLLDLLITSMT
jgi:hypothetical protein